MKKKIAVIGYGGQGSWHCRQLQNSDVAELAGVYDIDFLRRKAASEEDIHVFDSFESMINDNEVDAVVVATPNDCHKELVIRSLEAGKHVICEKPVDVSASNFHEMCEVAKDNRRILTVHQNRRWDVDFLAMKKLSESKEIGKIMRLESRIHGSRGIPSDWRQKKAYGGGMMLDWGVHLIDQVLQIFKDDRIIKVFCDLTHITGKEVDDGFRLSLYFQSGTTAYVEVGTYNFLALPRFYMQCEKGCAIITNWTENAHVAKMKAWNEKEVLPVQNASGITKTMSPRDSLTIDEYDVDKPESDVHDFYRNFCAAMDGKEELLVTHEEVMRVLKVMELAFESSKTGQTICYTERK